MLCILQTIRLLCNRNSDWRDEANEYNTRYANFWERDLVTYLPLRSSSVNVTLAYGMSVNVCVLTQ